MPVNYGSQYRGTPRGAPRLRQVRRLAHVPGRPWRRRLPPLSVAPVANDVAKLTVGRQGRFNSAMLTDAGGVIDDLIIYFLTDTRFRIVVNAGTADKDLTWMQAKAAEWKMDVAITPRRDGDAPLAIIAVQGPNARARVWQVLPQVKAASEALKPFFAAEAAQYFVARTGYTGEDGFEIMLPAAEAEVLWNALQAAGVAPCGLGARDTLRLEAGMNLYGQDMDETVSPLDAGLAWTVSLNTARFRRQDGVDRERPAETVPRPRAAR
jgi:aminomethyltransferase